MALETAGIFRNRMLAGKMLADRVAQVVSGDIIIVAVSRDGFPIADVVAAELRATSLYIPCEAITDPADKRRDIGIVNPGCAVTHYDRDVPGEYLYRKTRRIQQALANRYKAELNVLKRVLRGKKVVIVDDLVTSSVRILAALKLINRYAPAQVVVAVPTLTPMALQKLKDVADHVLTLETGSVQTVHGAYSDDDIWGRMAS